MPPSVPESDSAEAATPPAVRRRLAQLESSRSVSQAQGSTRSVHVPQTRQTLITFSPVTVAPLQDRAVVAPSTATQNPPIPDSDTVNTASPTRKLPTQQRKRARSDGDDVTQDKISSDEEVATTSRKIKKSKSSSSVAPTGANQTFQADDVRQTTEPLPEPATEEVPSTQSDRLSEYFNPNRVEPLPTSKKRTYRLINLVQIPIEAFKKQMVKPQERRFEYIQPDAGANSTNVAIVALLEAARAREFQLYASILVFKLIDLDETKLPSKILEPDSDIDERITVGLKAAAKNSATRISGGADQDDADDDNDEGNEDDDDDEEQINIAENQKQGTPVRSNGLDTSLPPLYNLSDIFEDIAMRRLSLPGGELRNVLGFLNPKGGPIRELRIATMCSGTECPLLALDLLNQGLLRQKVDPITYRHVFSCEIVPFKQAYIERNFNPEILFRDVTQLGEKQALTAYGGEVEVPGYVDLLVAGSSCVDYSNLNKLKKLFGEDGKSYSTFLGVLKYTLKFSPRIVILENVLKAPWAMIQGAFEFIDYETRVVLVDTKNFYIPQTRQRGYLVAFHKRTALQSGVNVVQATLKWRTVMESFQRRASSPFTDFIFSDDDQRLHQLKREMTVSQGIDRVKRKVDWERCRHRYFSYRSSHLLGFMKPFTKWENNGSCSLPDGSWLTWAKGQVERIWDTVDVNHLRCVAQRDYDMSYKVRMLELSQNIDRDVDSRPWGIVGCITPSGMPYLTTRRGPVTGPEALALQGIPIDKLSLTYETSRQLQDFAGNAMTSTVVCAAMLSALEVGYQILKPIHNFGSPPRTTVMEREILQPKHSLIERSRNLSRAADSLIAGRDHSLSTVLHDASKSLQLCSCEGQFGRKETSLQVCSDCGHTACTICGLNPLHSYQPFLKSTLAKRVCPSLFEEQIRKWLPLQIRLHDVENSLFTEPAKVALTKSRASDNRNVMTAIHLALGEACHLMKISRNQCWVVEYEGDHSRLELVFSKAWGSGLESDAEWWFYAKPAASEPAGSLVRAALAQPVARMICEGNTLFQGKWELRIPRVKSFRLSVDYVGQPVDSWEKTQGLQGGTFLNRQIHEQLVMSCDTSDRNEKNAVHGLDVLGVYDLLPDCDAACGSLYRKNAPCSETGQCPMFFFLDPEPLGNASEDAFVLARTKNRLPYRATRDIVARTKTGWRPEAKGLTPSGKKPKVLEFSVPGEWVDSPQTRLSVLEQDARIELWLPSPDTIASIDISSCAKANITALICSFPLEQGRQKEWTCDNVYHIDLIDKTAALRPFTWLLQRAGQRRGCNQWIDIDHSIPHLQFCNICAPAKPLLVHQTVQDKIIARNNIGKPELVEDHQQAFIFERNIKNRPSPVVAHLHCRDGVGVLEMKLNVAALLHRTSAKLFNITSRDVSASRMMWRLVVDQGFEQLQPFPRINMKSNQTDVHVAQPPSWTKEATNQVLPAQLRSLGWMLQQESPSTEDWTEQEIEETRIPSVDLRLEAKVELNRKVLGGVLADEVGYGKTATTLGLFDWDAQKFLSGSPHEQSGYTIGQESIHLGATLILVPKGLVTQWYGEFKKFITGHEYNVLMIKSAADLKKKTIAQFLAADLILTTWDVFDSDYYKELAYLGHAPDLPHNPGRAFDQWLDHSLQNLATLVKRSQGCEPDQVWSSWEKISDLKTVSKDSKTLSSAEIEAEQRCLKNLPRGKMHYTRRLLQTHVETVDMARGTSKPIIPLLHMFSYHRIVTDEFTYVKGGPLSLLLKLDAERKWVLSGTPPLGSFGAINKMALFLGTRLSTDDNDGGMFESDEDFKAKMSSKTEAEEFHFHSYQVRHSTAWYHARHDLCEKFVARFVRQNPADMKGKTLRSHYQIIHLNVAERAGYFELFQKLMSQPITFNTAQADKKESDKRQDLSDRTKRLLAMMHASRTPEEALLLACSTDMSFVNGLQDQTVSVAGICSSILLEKGARFQETVDDFVHCLAGVLELWEIHGPDDAKVIPHFHAYIRDVRENRFGDEVGRQIIHKAMIFATELAEDQASETRLKAEDSGDPEGRSAALLKTTMELKTRKKQMYEKASTLTNLSLCIVEHIRGLRFFGGVDEFVHGHLRSTCAGCGQVLPSPDATIIVGLCGHASCEPCFNHKIMDRKLANECIAKDCGAAVPLHSAFRLSDFGHNSVATRAPYGSKIAAVLNLLGNGSQIAKDEYVLIFVQFDRLRVQLIGALQEASIRFADSSKAGDIERFKSGRMGQVCILDIDSPDAAGWNLQHANHVVFLSSLVAKSQYHYESTYKQAIGRAFRRGLKATEVHVYHFLAARTVDVNILQERTGKTLVRRGDDHLLLAEEEIQDGDERGLAGAHFEGAVCSAGSLDEV